jgi:hypothetical protein
MKTWIFDKLDTADGHDIYWLHEENNNIIDPDDLYYDKYIFYEQCRDIVLDKYEDYINYVIEESQIVEWKEEQEDAIAYYNETYNR